MIHLINCYVGINFYFEKNKMRDPKIHARLDIISIEEVWLKIERRGNCCTWNISQKCAVQL